MRIKKAGGDFEIIEALSLLEILLLTYDKSLDTMQLL